MLAADRVCVSESQSEQSEAMITGCALADYTVIGGDRLFFWSRRSAGTKFGQNLLV